jgi:hypothetical protein
MNDKRNCDRCRQWVPKIGLHQCIKAKAVERSTGIPGDGGTSPNSPTHGITHDPAHARPKTGELRKAQTYRWRKRYPDRWRSYHSAYMRKWRAQAGAAS